MYIKHDYLPRNMVIRVSNFDPSSWITTSVDACQLLSIMSRIPYYTCGISGAYDKVKIGVGTVSVSNSAPLR
jgi:hypothetical protein